MNTDNVDLIERVNQAFVQVARSHFMPESLRHMAEADRPFPIGFGQTISQPYTVKNMLLWLAPQPGDKVLDVGSGSGWSTALLSFLVGSAGRVYGVEKIPELKSFGESNCLSYGCANVQFFLAEQHLGLAAYAPYDRILVSAAAANQIPKPLLAQLAPDGIMVIPVDHTIYELKKSITGDIGYCQQHVGYVFVPLVDC
ncbi:protein-L-isoaspartate O-methyltransferase family protein [Thalassotalea sp. ND16A]|uniref:protein-L-isoaspartate O-methyltransferase family protein n=1 Tax=Thalassotalea sp. ND16A TaxID=1535422 RepID=UPI00051A6122|nr:protein-L-isoaspartate O-methyltransferase [Thalassotalea sp. ND16A]KGJ95720.1 Protein-L-isoaspartate(D-aspartate) O-methyltransferase [Thalassotalea sp. ND16A]